MKTLSLLASLFLLASTVVLADHHVDGTWALEVDLGGQGGTASFELKETDGKLSGTYSGQLGSAEVTGTVDGANVEFSFDSEAGKITYKGKVSGNNMDGTCTYGQVGEGTFKGTKK